MLLEGSATEPNVSEKAQNQYLTIDEARAEMLSLGLDLSLRQVQRYAYERRLPFFKFAKSLWIDRIELHGALRKMQLAAVRHTAGVAEKWRS